MHRTTSFSPQQAHALSRKVTFLCLTSLFCALAACGSAEEGASGDATGGGGGDGDGALGSGGADQTPGTGGVVGDPGSGGSTLTGGSGGLGAGGGFATGGQSNTGGGADPGTGGETSGTGGAGGDHPPRSMGYVGCSMSDNVASGYAALGGDRMWPPLPAYWGQVVQDWANPNDPVWDTFDDQVDEFGAPAAVWIMVCIFNPPGVEIQEMRDIVGLVRQRAPNATIYATGQPFYDPGADCSIAGVNGPQMTDDMAQMMATDPSLAAVHYVGQFGPLGADEKSDACHANAAGQQLLGQQAVEFFGD